MEVKSKLSNYRTAPRKVRLVADLVRGKDALKAQSILTFTTGKACLIVLKLLNSALASAKHDFQLKVENLYISKLTVDQGPTLKRWHPMSRGRAYPIRKKTSHIALVLSERVPTAKVKKEDKADKVVVDHKTPKNEKPAKNKKEVTKKAKTLKKTK